MTHTVLLTTDATIDPHCSGLHIDYFAAAADATAAHLSHARRTTIEVACHIPSPTFLGPNLPTVYAD